MSHQYISLSAKKILDVARAEVGYHEGRDPSGNWNNKEKYAAQVPGLSWANGQPWCAVFVFWAATKAGFASLFPRTASTDTAARWWKDQGRWSTFPAIAAQGFLGHNGDMFHTFLVEDFDDTYVYTIEGNTNNDGSPQGDGVYQLRRRRTLAEVQGYGLPKFPEGVVSADPKFAGKRAAKPMVTVPHKPSPVPTPWSRTRERLVAAVNHPDAKAIPKTRVRVRALLGTIRAGLAGTPKF